MSLPARGGDLVLRLPVMVFSARDLRTTPARLCKAIRLTTETPCPVGRVALLDRSETRSAITRGAGLGPPRRYQRQEKISRKILAGSTLSNPAMTTCIYQC